MVSPTAAVFPGWRGEEPYGDALSAASRSLSENPPEGWFDKFEVLQAAQPAMSGYTCVGQELAAHVAGAPPAWLAALLLWHIDRLDCRFTSSRLDPEFRLQITDSVHRILARIAAETDWCRVTSDSYMKELGIVRLSVIPAVAQLVYPWSGLSRGLVLKGGPSAWAFVLGECGGVAPYLEIHTHDPMKGAYFNKSGWDETYRLVRKLLPAFPRHRGMMGVSWFYDPALKPLSPRLAYLQDVPLAGGARLLRKDASDIDRRLATATSDTRRAAVERGEYIPTKYALVWSRKAMEAS